MVWQVRGERGGEDGAGGGGGRGGLGGGSTPRSIREKGAAAGVRRPYWYMWWMGVQSMSGGDMLSGTCLGAWHDASMRLAGRRRANAPCIRRNVQPRRVFNGFLLPLQRSSANADP